MNITYCDFGSVACAGGYSFRKDKKTGYYLSSKKIDGKRKRLHVFVWEAANGEVPSGYEVHHVDRNKDNNDINNLVLLSVAEHRKLHADGQKESKRNCIVSYALPKAIEWHKSKEGKAWHAEHAREQWENKPLIMAKCTYCGKTFETKKSYSENQNSFCSNKCKAAYRRMTGIDNEERECVSCGKKFVINKYYKQQKCENCRNRKNRA